MNMFVEMHKAEQPIRPYIYETPLEDSLLLSNQTDAKVFLKCEHLQKTGAFNLAPSVTAIAVLALARPEYLIEIEAIAITMLEQG